MPELNSIHTSRGQRLWRRLCQYMAGNQWGNKSKLKGRNQLRVVIVEVAIRTVWGYDSG